MVFGRQNYEGKQKGRNTMKFKTSDEAKKWLRGLPLLKKELELKTAFYKELLINNRKLGLVGEKYTAYYGGEIIRLQGQLKQLTIQMDRLLDLLDPEERMIVSARYLRGISWDAMEFYVHYSRRQSIRIHNQAMERLVGVELGGDWNVRGEMREEPRTQSAGNGKTEGALALR